MEIHTKTSWRRGVTLHYNLVVVYLMLWVCIFPITHITLHVSIVKTKTVQLILTKAPSIATFLIVLTSFLEREHAGRALTIWSFRSVSSPCHRKYCARTNEQVTSVNNMQATQVTSAAEFDCLLLSPIVSNGTISRWKLKPVRVDTTLIPLIYFPTSVRLHFSSKAEEISKRVTEEGEMASPFICFWQLVRKPYAHNKPRVCAKIRYHVGNA